MTLDFASQTLHLEMYGETDREAMAIVGIGSVVVSQNDFPFRFAWRQIWSTPQKVLGCVKGWFAKLMKMVENGRKRQKMTEIDSKRYFLTLK